MNKILIVVVCLVFMSFYVTGQEKGDISVLETQYQIPVLIGKKNNPVLRIRVNVQGKKPHTLNQMVFDAGGTTDSQDIKTIRVYYYGTDSVVGDMQKPEGTLFGETSRLNKKITVNGSMSLTPGIHYFWISLELTDQANLENSVDLQLDYASVNKNKIGVSGSRNTIHQHIGVAVRQYMQDDIHTSRIPGLATTNKGTLLAIFDARHESSRDLQGDMDIGLHRSADGGQTWQPLQIAMDMGEWGGLPQKFNGVSDACILVDKNSDAIYIAGLWMHGVINEKGKWVEGLDSTSNAWNHQWRNRASQPGFGVKETSQFLLVKSTDDGMTWSEPINITAMSKKEEWWLWAPAPGSGVTMDDGTLVFPTQGRDEKGTPFSNITYSKDNGLTWQTSNQALQVKDGTTECAVVQLQNGSLMLNMRANKNRSNTSIDNGRAVAVTDDLGKTWREHSSSFSALPEPTCMASLHSHEFAENGVKRRMLVFSNPNTKTSRDHITVKVSLDDGFTWPERYWLLLDEWKGKGYSCITSIHDSHIGILYESSQADLVFQRISIQDLLHGKF